MNPFAPRLLSIATAASLALAGWLAGGALGAAPQAHTAHVCRDSSASFQLNPHLAAGVDPLTGARFFVDGAGVNRGFAATAIAHLRRHRLTPSREHQVQLLTKISQQPETKRFSIYSAGGGPGAIYSQVQKLLCRMQKTDPGADAQISTYFLIHSNCGTLRETGEVASVFRRHINELAEGVGNFPAVILLETDAVTTAGCLSHAGLQDREALLSYAIDRLSRLPHAVTYVEGGTSDATSPRFTAKILNAIGVRKIRGFFINDTHYNWTTNEINYGARVSRATGGTHFIVGTQGNGRGPLLNRHRAAHGNEDLCNPPGRGLGPRPTADTGFYRRGVDAFMWVGVPGRSAGTQCHPGDAPPGLFDEHFALQLAAHANSQLGPGYRSRPY